MKLGLKSKPVPNYDIRVKPKGGKKRWLNMSIFTYRMNGSSNQVIVYLFHDLHPKEVDGKVFNHLIDVVKRYQWPSVMS